MKKSKFKIYHTNDHPDEHKRGKVYRPPPQSMVVMNGKGIFFLFCGEPYREGIQELSKVLPKYDVKWV